MAKKRLSPQTLARMKQATQLEECAGRLQARAQILRDRLAFSIVDPGGPKALAAARHQVELAVQKVVVAWADFLSSPE
jgi:hypothetical protein